MNIRLGIIVLVLLAFGLFSTELVVTTGYLGFVRLAMREPWALQMLLDVTIAVSLFTIWMLKDAKAQGINAWPYVALCVVLGSIGALAYLAHRELKKGAVSRLAPAPG